MVQASAMKQRSDAEFPTCAGGEDRGHPAATKRHEPPDILVLAQVSEFSSYRTG